MPDASSYRCENGCGTIRRKHLRINDSSVAENGYQDHLLILNRNPTLYSMACATRSA